MDECVQIAYRDCCRFQGSADLERGEARICLTHERSGPSGALRSRSHIRGVPTTQACRAHHLVAGPERVLA